MKSPIRIQDFSFRPAVLPLCLCLSLVAGARSMRAADTNWSAASFDLPSKDSPEVQWWRDARTNLDERLAWFREARFGMFMHWGVYSGLGNEYHGRKGGTYAEHIQRVLKIPIEDYRREVAGSFNPTNFNAETWVRLARDAGMKYLVITSKHHDGFAMFATKVNHYNVVDATPWHHDPMADLKAACDKYGLKFGFYYSQAYDWGNTNAPGNDWDVKNPGGSLLIGGKNWWETKPGFMASARKYVDEKAIPQLRELIRLYHPAILWFDTASKLPPSENLRIMKAVREADPNVVISGRLVHGWGDYDDTTDRPANFPPHDGDWEAIPTTNESYGWSKFDKSHKPPGHFVRLLAKAAARGGNMLMNIGPMGTGEIDPNDVAILQGIARWWKVNGESIRGTTRTPLRVKTGGEPTRNGDRLYLHVLTWPTNGKLVVGGLKTDVRRAWLLAAGAKSADAAPALSVARLNPLDVTISVPKAAPDPADSVVVLDLASEPATDTTRLLQPQFADDVLRTFDGETSSGLRFGPGKKTDDYVINWTKPEQSVSWPVRLDSPANYEVLANYDAPRGSAGGTFNVTVGSSQLAGTVQAGTNQTVSLGRVSLAPGKLVIKVAGNQITGSELFRLRDLELRSPKNHQNQ